MSKLDDRIYKFVIDEESPSSIGQDAG